MSKVADERVSGYRHGRVPRAVREQQLLDHAERLFSEHGFAGFSIEDLCRAAGVSRPVVYDHFGSKDGVYLACLRRVRDEFETALIDAAANAPDRRGAVEQGADAFFAIVERDPRRWSLVYGAPSGMVGTISDQLYDLRAHTVARIAAIAGRFAPHADPETVDACAQAISGAGEQLARWWLRNPHVPRRRVVAHYVGIAEAALGYLESSRVD